MEWPRETDQAYPELFTKPPPQPIEKKQGQLTYKQLEQFFSEGYLIVDNFFDIEKDLEPCKKAIEKEVDYCANILYENGKVKNKYEDRGLFERLTCLGKEYPGANLVARKLRNLPQALRLLWTNEKLLNVVEQIVGPDIQGHPVWALRTKTPQNEATTVPWHQDSAFLDNDSYKVLQLTAWIPFLDATEENGCMQVVRRAHRKGKVATHQCCAGNTWYVILEEEEIERTLGANMKKDVVTCPVPYGGMLLFSNLLPHQSLLNQSDKIRWSVDFRWQTSKEKVGFWGLKPGVQMRMSNKPDFTIDWSEFDAINRYNVMAQHENENYLETVVTGPWMKKWELIHHNHHVNALLKQNEQDSYDNIVNP